METNTGELHAKTHESQPCRRSARTGSQVQAAQLLDAWVAGDRRRLDHLFNQCREENFIGERQDGREELLQYLALQMKNEPDLFAPRTTKPHLGVWIDTLKHLAE